MIRYLPFTVDLVNYLQILIADSQYQQAKIGYLQAKAQRFQNTVALFVALGGGWWNVEQGVETPPPDFTAYGLLPK